MGLWYPCWEDCLISSMWSLASLQFLWEIRSIVSIKDEFVSKKTLSMLIHINLCPGPLSLSLKPACVCPAVPLARLQRTACPRKSFTGGNLFSLLCTTMSYLCSILGLLFSVLLEQRKKLLGFWATQNHWALHKEADAKAEACPCALERCPELSLNG